VNIGQQGVSRSFGMGIAKVNRDLEIVRNEPRLPSSFTPAHGRRPFPARRTLPGPA
jgi:hypothetical protein